MIQKLFFVTLFFFCALAAFSQENQKNVIANDSASLFIIHSKKERPVNPDSIEKQPFFPDSFRQKIPAFKFSTDNLPIVTPKHLDGSLIVVKPDSVEHHYIKNFHPTHKKQALKFPAK